VQFIFPHEQRPMFWWKGRPIYLTTFLILIHVVAAFFTAFLLAMRVTGLIAAMTFSVEGFLQGEFWRVLTCLFIIGPSIWLLIELAVLWWSGMMVEQVMGWTRFLKFYLVLCLAPLVPVFILSPWGSDQYAGTSAANFAVFISFAVIYPDAEMIFNIKAKWWAWGLIGLTILQSIAFHTLFCVYLLFVSGVAYVYLKLLGIRGGFDWLNSWKWKYEKLRVQRINRKKLLESTEYYINKKVDPILDKISREGIQSLTEEEKRILEKAKDKLR